MASSRRAGTNESKWSNPGGAGSFSAGVNTFGATGNGRDYTAVSLWETDTDVDIVTATACPVLECYADSAAYAISGVTMAGATTSATYFRILRPASTARHLGVPKAASGAGVKFTNTDLATFQLQEANFHLYDIEVIDTMNSASTAGAINLSNVAGVLVVGVIATGTNSGTGQARGIRGESGSNDYIVVNCIAYGSDDGGINVRGATSRVLNCTVADNGGYGIASAVPGILINCLAQNSTTADYDSVSWATGTATNLSKDTSSSTVALRSKTVTFVDAANHDYRITNDADAVGQATDLSADATFAFDDDIAFTVRS